jgi:hypothetical protein
MVVHYLSLRIESQTIDENQAWLQGTQPQVITARYGIDVPFRFCPVHRAGPVLLKKSVLRPILCRLGGATEFFSSFLGGESPWCCRWA